MKALGFKRQLEIGELKNELTTLELPTPEPDPKQLLVKIHATCINIDDIHSAEGTFLGAAFCLLKLLKTTRVFAELMLQVLLKE